ncbi:response regulator transcription factor [Ferruginivarius sediminum]|uniref:DNA-binding response regulator n=1 Tax=Ferruginivarius sediminum TaxID=2661937 RepID=A0A369TBB0_9PROT|nr:response regulator transcription factor [Ferruginivarius sediminum]RDD61665.1 DNA-binding response regulator [Ferruginivarius sediminum]
MNALIIEDQELVLDLLRTFLERGWPDCHVAAASSLTEGVARLESDTDFNIVLLDLYLPEGSALEAVPRLSAQCPHTPVAVISGQADETTALACIEAGAKGFLPKSLSARAFAAAVDVILSGEVFFPWNLRDIYPQTPPLQEGNLPRLTPREKDVLRELGDGKSNKAIANVLGISEVTVKLHLRGLFRKLEAENRTQVIRRAIAHGLLE